MNDARSRPSRSEYDAIVVGGGHNGLTCAAYLAKAGRRVLVLERRHVLGGAAVSATSCCRSANETCPASVAMPGSSAHRHRTTRR